MDTKKATILKALYSNKGIVTFACESTDTPRSTYYKWLKEDEEFAAQVNEIQDVAVDFAEKKLFELINEGDTTATIFLLKTRGKKRGYIEKTEVDHSGSLGISWNETKTYDSNDKANEGS